MKNKSFISFCINVLVGILFSFPVFSAQSNINFLYQNKSEFNLFENASDNGNISNIAGSFAKYYTESKHKNISQCKVFGSNNSGNKDKADFSRSQSGFKEFLNLNIFLSRTGINTIYVNLSYLKDLRITKMLC